MVETEAERNAVTELLSESDALELFAVDLAESRILGVFSRSQGSTGYLVDIEQLILAGDTVYVYTKFSRPRPGDGVGAAATQPSHIVELPRSALSDTRVEWVLVSYSDYTEWPPGIGTPLPSPLATPTDVPGISVAFDSVLSGYDSRFSGEAEHLLVAETEAELSAFQALIHGDDAQATLAAADLDTYVLVGLFLPPRERTGHALAITRIVVQGNRTTIYAEVWEPQPLHPYLFSPARLHLYHIVRVPRTDLPAGEIEWDLVTYPMYVYPPWLE